MTILIAILLSLVTLGYIVYPLVRRPRPATAFGRRPVRKPVAASTTDDTLDATIEAQVKALRQSPASPAGFCGKCGASLKAGDRFCQRCGQRVN